MAIKPALRRIIRAPAYRRLGAIYRWLRHELRAHTALPIGERLSLWRRGFYAESALLYDLQRGDAGDYLSDFQYLWMADGWINAWDDIYNHKLALRGLLLARGLRQPETLAYIYDRRILADPFSPDSHCISAPELLDRLRASGQEAHYILKPESGSQGVGILLVIHRDGQLYAQRGCAIATFEFDVFLRGIEAAARRQHRWPPQGIAIERRLEQGAFWRDLFPESTNTIRVLTLWSPADPTPFIARAVQRIGTPDTVPTDNFFGGGIAAQIDLESGRLGVGVRFPAGGRRAERFSRHPNSDATIEGAVLPVWHDIADTVLRTAAALPFNRMAGWDVVVDASGTPVILEANGNSGVHILQAQGGLLSEPRTRRFYEAFGVVRPANGGQGRLGRPR